MITGYARLIEQGGFSGERTLAEKEDMWNAYGDSVERFMERCLNVTGGPDNLLPKQVTYTAYTAMCNDLGLVAEEQAALTRNLKRRSEVGDSRPRIDGERVRCYKGVRLSAEGTEYLDGDQR